MNKLRFAAAAAVLMVLPTVTAFAQGTPKPVPPAGGGAAATAGPIPATKIAVVNTEAFADEKLGIRRLVNMINEVKREFAPRSTELQQMQTRIKAVADEISKGGTADVMRKRQEEGDGLQRTYKFKAEEAQAAYEKRLKERAGPVFEDIGNALDAYAKQHGITLLLDASKMGASLLWVNENVDLTIAFINEYNSRNPVAASK
jgi:Skp family chaperone for outer membrane proteins